MKTVIRLYMSTLGLFQAWNIYTEPPYVIAGRAVGMSFRDSSEKHGLQGFIGIMMFGLVPPFAAWPVLRVLTYISLASRTHFNCFLKVSLNFRGGYEAINGTDGSMKQLVLYRFLLPFRQAVYCSLSILLHGVVGHSWSIAFICEMQKCAVLHED
jgi:hypothetical protein